MGNYALGAPGKRASLYVRVSTDKQTVENQVARLTEVAKGRGWEIVATFNDAGISGAKELKDRPGLDQMLKDASKGRFDVVMTWAIDRLGVLATVQHLENCGVDLFIDRQFIDTTTPTGKLMFQIVGAFAELERGMIRERVHAGLKRAVATLPPLNAPVPSLVREQAS
jgi:DNA invertase Pin-like site-specific DNA recombinase